MHSRKLGRSGSKRPFRKQSPAWVRYKGKEVEMLITKLAKEGKTASEIGLIMRDTYGIPNVKEVTDKKINKILEEHKVLKEIPEDLMALIKKSIALRKHLEENHKDQGAKRGLILTESKIKRLVKYYKAHEKLPAGWKYDPRKIRLYVE